MRKRLHCPACPGTPALPQFRAELESIGLHRCPSCRGVLADHATVVAAKKHFGPSHPVLRAKQVAHRCRVCGGRAAVGVPRCGQCSASLLLRCPCCSRPMAVVEVDVLGIVVDVCGACELTFFDAGELAHACGAPTAFASAVRQRASAPSSAARRGGVDVIDIVTFAPVDAIEAVGYGASAAGHVAVTAAGHVANAVGQVNVVAVAETTGAAALGAAHAASEAADTAGETILEVLASLFN
jgi:Zn-finger nucleic acid-binding protein